MEEYECYDCSYIFTYEEIDNSFGSETCPMCGGLEIELVSEMYGDEIDEDEEDY
jgi:hypothetical protein